jgi:hypothetical protein
MKEDCFFKVTLHFRKDSVIRCIAMVERKL